MAKLPMATMNEYRTRLMDLDGHAVTVGIKTYTNMRTKKNQVFFTIL